MTEIDKSGSSENAINDMVSKMGKLKLRFLSGLSNLVYSTEAPTSGGAKYGPNVASTVSYLDATAPERSPIGAVLDELDAQFDAAAPPSPDDIVLTLVPESSRPHDPSLN